MTDQDRHFNFTKKALENLKCPIKGQVRYWDTKTPGLGIRVSYAGQKSFIVRKKHNNQASNYKIGSFPEMSVEQARNRAPKELAAIIDGEVKGNKRGELTFGDLFDQYLEHHANKKKTVDAMRKDFERNLGDWKDKRVSHITLPDVEALHNKLTADRGPYTANRTIQLLRAIFNKAITRGVFKGTNPAKGITLNKEETRERFLRAGEAAELLAALELEKETNENLYDFINLSFFTGVRKTNLMSIKWEWIDLKLGLLTIPETKNNTPQIILLDDREIALLKDRLKRLKKEAQRNKTELSDFVFPGSGKDGHLKDLKRSWTTFRKKHGLFTKGDRKRNLTIHDLRRSLGANMANANINLALIKGALHHKDIKTTLTVYARTDEESIRNARRQALLPILKKAGLVDYVE